MLLQRKKGDIVITFVVIIVVTIAMIFVVTSFGSKIISSMYPNGDKSTVRSFDALYNVVNIAANSNVEYDMTAASVYLKKNYCIVLFDKSAVSKDNDNYYAPKECREEKFKQCICLYDGTPKQTESKKDKNVIKCNIFSGTDAINLDPKFAIPKYTDLSPILCSSSGEAYKPFLIVRNTTIDKPYIYILNDNDDNSNLAKSWEVRICPPDPDNAHNICNGKRDGAIIFPTDEEGLKNITEYCAQPQEDNKTYNSTSVRCIYRADKRDCFVDCKSGDVSGDCQNKYKTCEDLNQLKGVENSKYMSTEKDYSYYYMCNNDAIYCKRGCQVYPFEVYIDKNTMSLDGSIYSGFDKTIIDGCNLKILSLPHGHYGGYLTSYNESNETCVKYLTDATTGKFYPKKSTFFECKSGLSACNKFIEDSKDCSIKALISARGEGVIWITYYNSEDAGCDAQVKELFTPIYSCGAKESS